jgi:hypothetical protein
MRKRFASLVMLLSTAAVTIGGADAGYFGTWRLNPAKSDFGTVSMAFSRNGDTWTATQDGKSYTFKMDGNSYPTSQPPATEVWKQVDTTTWQVTAALDGKRVGVDTYTLSADGKTLTDTGKADDPSAMPGWGSAEYHRAGGGTGLAGTWNGKARQEPFTLQIAPSENDGLIYRVVGVFEVKGHFDGKPSPMTGPMVGTGSTATFSKTGQRSFASRQLDSNQPPFTVNVSVSPDGESLTVVGKGGSVKKRVWVFDRQR